MVAGSTSSGKSKGRELQKYVASSICESFMLPESEAVSRPMGSPGSDIIMSERARKVFPFSIECKRQESLNVGIWMDQTCANAAKDHLAPLLVIRQNHDKAVAVILTKHLMAIVEGVGYPDGIKPSIEYTSRGIQFKRGIINAQSTSQVPGSWIFKNVSPLYSYSILPYMLLIRMVTNYWHSPDNGGIKISESFSTYSGERK
ncbi:MAG: hypothetical protein WC936_04650 [Candidatus Nanoarchaeia archaeon]|jgi:hypothetical protein